jgi:hypothetical protein
MTKKTRENRRRRRRRKRKTQRREREPRGKGQKDQHQQMMHLQYTNTYTHTTHTYHKRRRVLRNSSLGGLKTGGAWKETHLKIQIQNSWVNLQTQNAFFDEQRWSSSPPWVCFNRQAAKSKLCCSETMVRTKHFDEAMKKRQNSKCDLQRPTRPLP